MPVASADGSLGLSAHPADFFTLLERPMLILTRRVAESIKIGSDITVTILGFSGKQVRIGIDAPKKVAVHREEVAERIKLEKASDFP